MESLQNLVGRLTQGYLSEAAKYKNIFVNEVPSDLGIEYNHSWVCSIINGLFNTIVQHSRETCIRISARRYGYVMVLEVKESGSVNGYAMACGLQEINSLAEKIGGCLSISVQQPTTTVAFSFPNLPLAN
ncbi:MAG: hypothetical protein NVV59_00655 [Chitinophagaceae bacterium]|nr:hypothetical protein [Chitinophagaceae bacterium]